MYADIPFLQEWREGKTSFLEVFFQFSFGVFISWFWQFNLFVPPNWDSTIVLQIDDFSGSNQSKLEEKINKHKWRKMNTHEQKHKPTVYN